MKAAVLKQLDFPDSFSETDKLKFTDGELPTPIEAPIEMNDIITHKRSILADLGIIEVILGHRAYFFASIRDCENLWAQIRAMVISCFVFYGIYGAVMGGSQGPLQSTASAVKLPLLFIITFFICSPSLYFFNKLFGSNQKISQYIALVLSAMTIMGILLVSFAPVSFFFLITGSAYQFFKLLNVFFFAVAGILSVLFFRRGIVATRDPQNLEGLRSRRFIFFAWVIMYAFVGTQMAWILSPFMGEPHVPFVLFTQGGNFYADVINSLRQLLGQ